MELLEKLIFLNRPFGYISKNVKRVILDLLALEEDGSSSYAYQYFNSSYYGDLAYAIGIWIAAENLSGGGKLLMDTLELGQGFQFRNKYYRYLGKDEIKPENCKVQLIYKNTHGFSSFPKEILENEASAVTQTKNRKLISSRQELADFLEIKEFSRTNNKSIIILMERKLIDELLNTFVDLENEKYSFNQVCSSRYLKDDMEIISLPKMNNVEKPMILFSSSARAVVEYLDEHGDKAEQKKVFVIGDKWLKDSQISNLVNLEDACNEFQIRMRIYTSIPMVMKRDSLDLISSIGEEYCWLSPTDNKAYQFNYQFIENNAAFEESIILLNEVLSKIKLDPFLKYLDKLLKTFLRMSYSLTGGNSKTLESQLILILEYIKKKNLKEFDNLHNILGAIYENRFGYDVKKKIEQVRFKSGKCVLIVTNQMFFEISEVYRKDKQLTIIPYSDVITEDLYNQFDQAILLSPYASDRKKWLSSYFCERVTMLIPRLQEKFLNSAFKKEKQILKRLYTLNYLSEDEVDSAYLQSINDYLTLKKNDAISKEDVEIYESLDIEWDNSDSHELSMGSCTEDYDNTIVDVESQINLESGDIIMATRYGRLFILEDDGKIKRVEASKIKVDETLVEFTIPYSDEFYRKRLKNTHDRIRNLEDLEKLQSIGDEYYDYFWKRELLTFVKNKGLSAQQLKKRFEKLGFPAKTYQFYKSWSSFETIQILPQNREFIKFVGILTGNKEIVNQYKKYVAASEAVKRKLVDAREQFIDSIEGKNFEDIIIHPVIKDFVTDKVIQIKPVSANNFPRNMTNRIIGRDTIEHFKR
ncbi:hypothetical protein KUA55_14220 [Enterococcus sp. ALS3]|uniref:Uncharacterized protein n=1 Tax=Enterococcus alishanensis TaxID=1303817 RepID=A0ABS6TG14_9ENTE|nr:hypothetical protein [Enterococcus alishanensis]MBV7391841.1 hypothetical protein [Enterococcus alishanensis]